MSINPQEAKKLEAKILKILQLYIKKNDTIVAGISGGPDSTFLLHMLNKVPCKIIAAHVNHQLRKESASEEKFVKKLAENLKKTTQNTSIDFFSITANITALSKELKQGTEETARKVRYDFFKELAKKHKAKYIITAHHADDNLETIILNFTRGASLQGLIGMQEIEMLIPKLSLLRPLLSISKRQILDYLKFHKIPFKTDKSNRDTIYKRNFIRHKIVPLLQQINPGVVQTTAQNAQNLREINDFLKTEAQEWLKKNTAKSDQKSLQLPLKNFRSQNPALQKTIILEIYQQLTGSTQNLKAINLTETIQLINSNIGNKQKKLGKIIIELKTPNLISILPFGKTKTH